MSRTKFLFLSCMMMAVCSFSQETDMPSDTRATKETARLYRNLKKLAAKGFMFGHQDDLAYGVNWKYESGRSDVKEVVNDYPAVYGWELGNIEYGYENNIDGVPFKKMQQFIKEGYERGGVITVSWHAHSPYGYEKGAWDTTHGTVLSILPGGVNHTLYKTWLDKVAAFFLSLQGSNREAIPVLFRPFHEHTGTWFWWCKNACTDDEYKTLWRFTVYYLREIKNVHNLIYIYNTADFGSGEEFLRRYPGDDVADMLSFDSYQYGDPQKNDGFVKTVNQRLSVIEVIGTQKNKPIALSETGYEAIPYAEWWTKVLSRAIADHKISYVLVWRNHGYNESMKKMHYYAPYKGQLSANDFIEFYKEGKTLFGRDVKEENLYQK